MNRPASSYFIDTERDTRRFRLLALVIVSTTIHFRVDELALGPAIGSVVAFFLYTFVLGPVLAKIMPRLGPRRRPSLIYLMAGADALAVISLVHFTGGITSITIILIPLFIIYHTIYLGTSSGLASATLFSALYLAAAGIEKQIGGNVALLVGQVGLFFVLARLSAYLGKRSLVEAQERELLQDLIFDVGAASGVRLETVTLEGDVVSCVGAAGNDTSLERFLERVQEMRRLSSVRLSRGPTSSVDPGAPPVRPIEFTLTARIR